MVKSVGLLLLLALLLVVVVAQIARGALVSELFQKDGIYACYKIPYLYQTITGKLLALAEARGRFDTPTAGDCDDWTDTDVVLKWSTDYGATWSNETKLVIPGRYGIHTVAGNLAIVQDQFTGRILMPFNRGNVEMWITYSDDDGETWIEPSRLGDNERRLWTWIGFGPPAGLQLLNNATGHRGRLMFPVYYSTWPFYDNGLLTKSIIFYSDDGGETWQESKVIRNGFLGFLLGKTGNEAQIVELQDGSLLINSRTLFGNRIQSRSTDGGETWSTYQRTNLPTPFIGCQGSIVSESDSVLLYSGPGGPKRSVKRTRMTVWESFSDGREWEELVVLFDETLGGVSYSSMVRLWNGTVAILYEISEGVSETIFEPGGFRFEYIETGRAASPLVQPNASAFAPVSYNESWQDDDGGAFDFTFSPSWYAIAIFNGIFAIAAVFLFSFAGLCPCCCCCAPVARKLQKCRLEREMENFDDDEELCPCCFDPRTYEFEWRRDIFVFLFWAFKVLASIGLGFALLGVIASYGFPYDDGSRWKLQSRYSRIILIMIILISLAVILYNFKFKRENETPN